jgi:hypothetical protein
VETFQHNHSCKAQKVFRAFASLILFSFFTLAGRMKNINENRQKSGKENAEENIFTKSFQSKQ